MNQEAHDILNAVKVIDLQILRLMSKKKMLESCLYPSGIRYDLDKYRESGACKYTDCNECDFRYQGCDEWVE